MIDKVILDADFCIKVGRFEKALFLQEIIPRIAKKAYVNKYVFEAEILIPQCAKEQIRKLIDNGQAELIDETCFDPAEQRMFYAIRDSLMKVMIGTEENGKNWGEVLSLACAKVLGITVFMSDEGSLQGIINRHLNTGISSDIHVFRIVDLVKWIKENPECGINRKIAKAMWVVAGNSKDSFQTFWE